VLLDDKRIVHPVDRLLIPDDAFAQADKEVITLLKALIERAAPALPKPSSVRIAPGGFDEWREAFRVIQGVEVRQHFGDFITKARPKLGPGIKERMAFAMTVSESDAVAARRVHEQARAQIRQLLPPGTVLALPSAPCIAPRIDTAADALESFRVRVMRLTCLAGLSGLPQVSIPAGTVAGCPVGLSFIGWAGGDEALLELAFALSRFCGLEG
jgi:amidase